MKKDTFATCMGLIVSTLALIVIGTLVEGWALKTIWNWFMSSVFSLTPLTIWQAIGVSMVFQLFTGTNKVKNQDKTSSSNKTWGEIFVTALIEMTVSPVVSVFIAWIIFNIAF